MKKNSGFNTTSNFSENNKFFSKKGSSKNMKVKGKWPTASEVADMVKTGAAADTTRTPITFLDPAYFNPILFFIQHRDRKELNFRLRYEYEFQPHVHNLINLHSQFPLSDFECNASDSKHEQYYNDFKDRVELLPLSMDILKDWNLLGESFVHGRWDESEKTWKDFVMYPPEYVEVKGTHVTAEKLYFLEVDNKLKTMVSSQDKFDKELTKNMDPSVVDAIRSSGKVWLKPDQTFCFMQKTGRYDLRGTSPVKSIFEDLLYEHKLRLLQFTFCDRHMFPIKIWKLGDPAKGWIPPASHFQNFRDLLTSAANDPDFNLIFHYGLQVDYVGTKDKIANLIPEFEFVENRILTGLFANKSLLHGEGISYANANVSVRVLMHRYLVIRDMLELMFKNKIFRRIAQERGWYRSDTSGNTGEPQVNINGKYRVLDIPKIKWRKLNLLDDTAQKQFLLEMRKMKDLPHKTLAEAMDLDPIEIEKRLKEEEGTPLDPHYQSAMDTFSDDKEIAAQILQGKKFDSIDFMGKDSTKGERDAAKSSKPSMSIRPTPVPTGAPEPGEVAPMTPPEI